MQHTDRRKILLSGQWGLAVQKHSLYYAAAGEKTDYASVTAGFCGCEKRAATVPGCIESELFGGDPYFGMNPVTLREYECLHMLYTTAFTLRTCDGEEAFLVFEGIDTAAEIYLDGQLALHTENMFIPHRISLAGLDEGEHTLAVHITPAAIFARRFSGPAHSSALRYNYAGLHLRKAAHSLGWDIFPRLVSAGLWREVYIEYLPCERIDDVFFYTVTADGGSANICLRYELTTQADFLNDMSITVEGSCGDSRFAASDRLWHTSGRLDITVEKPLLWQPRNRGEQNLYAVTVKLMRGKTELDRRELSFGIRTVRLERSSVEDGSGEFCFYVNGERLFVMGTNWVPVDALHRPDPKRFAAALALLADSGCNMVRCWGGGIYENDEFYEFCDKNGILVWQDFMMGCSVYPQDTDFQRKMRDEVTAVVRRLRGRACIAVWAGDNECDCAEDWGGFADDPNKNVITRRVIPDVLHCEDRTRPYLPSSPYIDETARRSGLHPTEEHLWGPRDYFKGEFYSGSVCHFASETGYHGCPDPESVKEFISPDQLWPWQDNPEWLCHAASPEAGGPYDFRIELMAKQVKTLFGDIPDGLAAFSAASQASQAEAMKYFIERFRISKWRRSGIIWWNLLDGWPQFSDAVVDYYFRQKQAYKVIKRCQQPLLAALGEPDEQGRLTLNIVNDLPRDCEFTCRVIDMNSGKEVLAASGVSAADSAKEFGSFIPDGRQHFYLLSWEYEGNKCLNHYQADNLGLDFESYIACYRRLEQEEAK